MRSENKFSLWMLGYAGAGFIGFGAALALWFAGKPPNWWLPLVYGVAVLGYATWDYAKSADDVEG
jgi:hypothetical protein